MQYIQKTPMKFRHKLSSSLLLLGLSSIGFAGSSANFSIDGQTISSSSINIAASQEKSLRYTGGRTACTDVEWFFKKAGDTEWKNFDHDNSATLEAIHRSGQHQLKMTTRGYDGRYFFNLLGCNQRGKNDQRTVSLNIATPGYTQTENPIMLVPGVMAWDDIFGMEYFYRVADEIRKTSDQAVADVSMAAWQNTEDRGADLANKVLDFLIINDDNFSKKIVP